MGRRSAAKSPANTRANDAEHLSELQDRLGPGRVRLKKDSAPDVGTVFGDRRHPSFGGSADEIDGELPGRDNEH